MANWSKTRGWLNRGVLVGLGAAVLVGALLAVLLGQFTDREPQPRVATGNTPVKLESAPALSYPQTRTGARVDEYFGVQVVDPYRWLESQVRESAEVAQWVAEQNGVTFAYLDTLEDRYRIKDRLTALWDYERFSLPRKEGGRYFYRKNDGLQNQYSLYVAESPGAQPQLLIDPNTWSVDGATALAGFVPSPDGSLVLYGVQDGGSDWRVLKVLDIATARTLDDTIEWVKFSGLAWAPDSSGFFYSRYPQPDGAQTFQALNYDQMLYFHTLGEDQGADRLVYARPDDPSISVRGYVMAERFLIVEMSRGTDARYEIAVMDLAQTDSQPVPLISGFADDYRFFAADNRVLYALTDRGAPNNRVVAIDLDAPIEANWREVIAESEHLLDDVSYVGGVVLATYLEDVKSVVRRFDLAGEAQGEVTLPGIGAARGFAGHADDPETFYTFSSYNTPGEIHRYDTQTGESELFRRPDTPFDPSAYEVTQVFFQSSDGTIVPMFISHRRGLDLTGGAPALLYGYGGFNISLTPGFSLAAFGWMEMGGIYAVANLRGGGEYGKPWHEAGRLENKQNVFDDFIAAAEYLVAEGYTTPAQLGILGRSNGGLLVGAATNQRPELFAVALPGVGVMDMLRFDQFTAGRFWRDDYGSPSENEQDFATNYAFSPYHNIRDGVEYPAVLVTTADTDDRVVPGHSFKYAAALQAAQTGDNPKLIRIETRAGHGSGKPTGKVIEEYADLWAFLAEHTGLELPESYGN